MTVQEVAKAVMKVTKTTQQKVADTAGLAGQGTVAMFLKSKSMRVENLQTILNACGYELVARSADRKYPDFVIGEEMSRKEEAPVIGDGMEEMIRKIVAEEVRKATGGK